MSGRSYTALSVKGGMRSKHVYSALLECLFMQFPVNVQSIQGYRDVCNQSSKVHARLALLLKGYFPILYLNHYLLTYL